MTVINQAGGRFDPPMTVIHQAGARVGLPMIAMKPASPWAILRTVYRVFEIAAEGLAPIASFASAIG